VPRTPGRVVQECGVGLVPVRIDEVTLAFVAPPLIRSGPVDDADLAVALAVLGVTPADVVEDPVTGSLNASVAQWLTGSGRVAAPYMARRGAKVGRDGRVRATESEGTLWIGGRAVVTVTGNAAV